jgi:hypothetical protein
MLAARLRPTEDVGERYDGEPMEVVDVGDTGESPSLSISDDTSTTSP